MRAFLGIAAVITLALWPAASLARDNVTALFASHEVVHLTLKGPIGRLIANRAASSRPVTATLSVQGDSSEPLPVILSLRGMTRRKAETCAFPPLRVEFPQDPSESSLFRGQSKLKLVTHCRSAPSFQQYTLLEYSAYRLYNVLTPQSFNARLVQVDYQEPDGKLLTSRIGFFLENEKDLARRNGLRKAKIGDKIALAQLDASAASRHALFEDLIGNLDWSMTTGPKGVECCHNTKLIGQKEAHDSLIPVPYDFDATGLVDPPYAEPPNGFDVPDILTRQYRGFCVHNAQAQAAAAGMRAHQAEMVRVLEETPNLEEPSRRKSEAYLESFFKVIASDEAVSANLLSRCRPG